MRISDWSSDVCSSDLEARTFLGLPDLKPVHDIYVDRMQALIRDGLTGTDFDRVMKSWSPLLGGGLEMWANAMQQLACGYSPTGQDRTPKHRPRTPRPPSSCPAGDRRRPHPPPPP